MQSLKVHERQVTSKNTKHDIICIIREVRGPKPDPGESITMQLVMSEVILELINFSLAHET